jgi:hypothetical protein
MKNKILIFGITAIIIGLLGCKKNEPTRWDDPLNFYNEDIASYHEAALGIQGKEKSGNQSVYVDFSDGIKQAMQESSVKNIVKYFSGILTGDEIDWFGLGERKYGGVNSIKYDANRDFFNLVTTPDNYTDIYAPIEEALKQIVSKNNDAILITDFEEYSTDRTEQMVPYARPYFTKWLNEGNSITFYYHEYTEINSLSRLNGRKNLFFVIFNYGDSNENSLLTKFENAIKQRPGLERLQKFEITINPYFVSNDYGGKQKTGLTLDTDVNNKSALEVGDKEGALLFYHNGFIRNNKPYEAFEFGQNLNDLHDFYFKGNGRFAKNLFLDASNNISYKLKNVKVEVSDVTNDYVNFIRSSEAIKNTPILIKDEGNNDVWDETNINEIMMECYEKNSKNIKKQYIYNYTPGSKVSEVFDFDASIFSDRLRNSPGEVELITTFHKNFNGKFNNNESIILRIDYLIESTEENYSSQLDAFKWNSIINAANGVNESISESIRNTLQAVKPKGILYSYYLKLEPST